MIVMIVHLLDDYFYWILYYIPYYHLIKFTFFVLLFHPKFHLANTFYDIVKNWLINRLFIDAMFNIKNIYIQAKDHLISIIDCFI